MIYSKKSRRSPNHRQKPRLTASNDPYVNLHHRRLRLEALEDRRLLSFANTTAISIPVSGVSDPYPSDITVSELQGTITDVNVTLTGLTHSFPGDIDILLVGPQNQKVIILSDVGTASTAGVNLTLDDAATNSLPSSGALTSGTYKPTNAGTGDTFALPAPVGPYAAKLNEFNGTDPNGTWSLFVVDDTGGDLGSIAGGWSLSITTTGGTCTIGDIVWNDLNSNGVQDTSEPGLAGWETYLDSNINGHWDAGEPKILTDANGKYTFTGLPPGTYTVAQVPHLGWTKTFPTTPGIYSITLASGETRNDLDFGIHELAHQVFPIIASVDGKVQDNEPDGVFEFLETAGSIIDVGSYSSGPQGDLRGLFEFSLADLTDTGSILDASLSFYIRVKDGGTPHNYSLYGYAGDGIIALADVSAPSTFIGSFQVTSLGVITVPLDTAFFESLRGTTNFAGIILRMNNVENSRINIDSLERADPVKKPTLNLNALVIPRGNIQSTVWNDLDSDGIQDSGEPGLAGVTVELYSSDDATTGNVDDVLLKQTVTDAKGDYTFNRLSTGSNYYLKFRAPTGFTFTAKDAGSDDTLDSDTDSSGVTSLFTATGDQIDKTRDAGLTGTAPPFGFGFLAGGTGHDEGRAVATDAAGDVYVIGQFEGTADFDPGSGECNLISEGKKDIFIVKYSSNGALVWARRIGGTDDDTGVSIAVANDGTVYTTGSYRGTVDFDPGPGTFNLDNSGSFILKLGADGNLVWARGITGAGLAESQSIGVANDGSVYTVGHFTSTFDFDPGDGVCNLTSSGEEDIFVTKLTSTGNLVWARQTGGSGHDFSHDIAVAADGSLYITGTFQSTVDFDPGAGTINLTSAGEDDIFVWEINASGNYVWAKRFGGVANETAFGIAVGPDGGVYTTGTFGGEVDFDPGPGQFVLTGSSSAIFVSKLSSGGTFVWARGMSGDNGMNAGLDIAVDASGVYTTGYFDHADFDPGAGVSNLTSTGAFDIFLSKLDSAGNFVWARRVGGTGDDRACAIDVADNGSVYLAGRIEATIDANPGPGTYTLTSSGGYDAFLDKLLVNRPTDIALSANSLAENQAVGTIVGTFSSTYPDPAETLTYTLVAGSGSDNNASFAIDAGGRLITAATLDFETRSSYNIRVRTTDFNEMWFEKTFSITATDLSETFIIIKSDWPTAGLTLKLASDGKIHAYQTGTTTDAVPPHLPASVTSIQITGRGLTDVMTVVSMGSGIPELTISRATLVLNQDNAITTGTKVTVNGGLLNFNGHTDAIGNLILINDGQVTATSLKNPATTVSSGTLTAASITCDSLIIGTGPFPPRTVTWDGGGADNKWSTAANWLGDVAPASGDSLVFPAGAARTENINDYPRDTLFKSITITGGTYRIQDHPINSATVTVQGDSVLTTSSIICDSLVIGSPAPTIAALNDSTDDQDAHGVALQSLMDEDLFDRMIEQVNIDLLAGSHFV